MSVLVLITGAGRSGTSTMAGVLHHAGLWVPGPYLKTNRSNPKGFYESRWSVKFHERIARRARVDLFDARPHAFDLFSQAVLPRHRAALAEFVEEESRDAPALVVKDPRTVWSQGLWRAAALRAGLETRYLVMLRHPAEVVGSRLTYYAQDADRRRFATLNVARWINHTLITERETREWSRAFVKYEDLIQDWRTTLVRLRDELGVPLPPDVGDGASSPIDDFIDPGLRRHGISWDGIDLAPEVRDLAERLWAVMVSLGDGAEGAAELAEIERLTQEYAELQELSATLSEDARSQAWSAGHAAGLKEGRRAAEVPSTGESSAASDDPGSWSAALRPPMRTARAAVRRARQMLHP